MLLSPAGGCPGARSNPQPGAAAPEMGPLSSDSCRPLPPASRTSPTASCPLPGPGPPSARRPQRSGRSLPTVQPLPTSTAWNSAHSRPRSQGAGPRGAAALSSWQPRRRRECLSPHRIASLDREPGSRAVQGRDLAIPTVPSSGQTFNGSVSNELITFCPVLGGGGRPLLFLTAAGRQTPPRPPRHPHPTHTQGWLFCFALKSIRFLAHSTKRHWREPGGALARTQPPTQAAQM